MTSQKFRTVQRQKCKNNVVVKKKLCTRLSAPFLTTTSFGVRHIYFWYKATSGSGNTDFSTTKRFDLENMV